MSVCANYNESSTPPAAAAWKNSVKWASCRESIVQIPIEQQTKSQTDGRTMRNVVIYCPIGHHRVVSQFSGSRARNLDSISDMSHALCGYAIRSFDREVGGYFNLLLGYSAIATCEIKMNDRAVRFSMLVSGLLDQKTFTVQGAGAGAGAGAGTIYVFINPNSKRERFIVRNASLRFKLAQRITGFTVNWLVNFRFSQTQAVFDLYISARTA